MFSGLEIFFTRDAALDIFHGQNSLHGFFSQNKIPQPPPLPHIKNQMVALLLSPTEKDAMEMGKASAGGGFNHAGIGGAGGASSPGTSGSGSGGDGCTAPMCFGGGQTLGRFMLHQEDMPM